MVYQGEKLAKGVTLYPKLWGGFKVDCQEEDLIMAINLFISDIYGNLAPEYYIEEERIFYYCGFYSGCLACVIYPLGDYLQGQTLDQVTDDVILKYPDGLRVVFCYKNTLFSVGDVYKYGLMTLEDIKKAYNNYLIAREEEWRNN